MLYALRFKRLTMVATCAAPGATISNMSTIANNPLFRRALPERQWDVVPLSGGGNDLIDNVPRILLPPAKRTRPVSDGISRYVDTDALNTLMGNVRKGFRKLARLRDRAPGKTKDAPIVTLTYDYAVPQNEPVRFLDFDLQGPWLYTAVQKAGIPVEDWIPVARSLSDSLAKALQELEQGTGPVENFHVVNILDTLTPPRLTDVGPTTHWLNEIHPNCDGYSLIAEKIDKEKLDGLLYR